MCGINGLISEQSNLASLVEAMNARFSTADLMTGGYGTIKVSALATGGSLSLICPPTEVNL